MSARICEAELVREARRILRKLCADDSWLAADGNETYVLVLRGRVLQSAAPISKTLVHEFAKRDWLHLREGEPQTYVLSDAGEGWLLREAVEQGDPFAAQHRAMVTRTIEHEDGTARSVAVNEGESPLGWLYHRKLIGAAQFEAGERLRRDFTLAQLTPRMGVDYSAPIVMGSRGAKSISALPETVLAAKQRFAAAMRGVGAGLSDLLFDVCCHLNGLEEVERAQGWPRRAGKVVLQIALDRLAIHYGIAMRSPARAKTRGWQMEVE
ncbi:MAG TPA: DUF6456 domain-containing protein [Rhizomicrobium sp.]|nr:DUF6456 domain-containing protein [Rhizomicrobium sp.]